MEKKALVVAGGQWQVPLIKFLQHNHYLVTVVDPYLTSKGVLIADKQIQEDVRAKEQILDKIDESFDLVCTDQSDISVETVAFLADRLHLKGNHEDIVQRFSNKYLSRAFAQSIEVPVPAFCRVTSVNEIKKFADEVGYPLMLKPCDSQSSKGIHKIDKNTTDDELSEYLEDALSYSFIKEAILEQFVRGYEITVEGFCAQGKHRVLAISKKKHFKTGIASALTYPAPIPKEIEDQIIFSDNKYVEMSGLEFGPTHAEYIVNEETGQFFLVEIACRGGGTLISSDIVKWVSGFDVYQAYLNCLEGRKVDLYASSLLRRSAELHFFDFGSGKIESINGIDTISKMDGVLMIDFDHKVGDVLRTCEDDRSRQGFVIVLAENPQILDHKIEQICNTLQVELSNE